MGLGSWRSDSLAPGTYDVAAELPCAAGCPSAVKQATVVLDSGVKTVRLAPKACGWLRLTAEPAPASYVLQPVDGGKSTSGMTTTPPDSITLAAGSYALSLAAPQCASYADTIEVRPGTVLPRRVKLICAKQ